MHPFVQISHGIAILQQLQMQGLFVPKCVGVRPQFHNESWHHCPQFFKALCLGFAGLNFKGQFGNSSKLVFSMIPGVDAIIQKSIGPSERNPDGPVLLWLLPLLLPHCLHWPLLDGTPCCRSHSWTMTFEPQCSAGENHNTLTKTKPKAKPKKTEAKQNLQTEEIKIINHTLI